ncbi:helix-turn-helix domain-containing protein [Kitasatospora aureofaciens]|uniref:helix-turn-helix domain-containing protein n=1 Tax=Kitasatospora aureofaciens TaxID=1894 RepID=UPI0007C5AB3A|nr:pyridoxamine 5'-phosphate oxidase family protein [Kitasatospora aureofaciens]
MKYTRAKTAEPRSAHPGDIGRRVTRRRQLLGLSRQDVADRVGMAPEYVEYVESAAEAVDTVTLTRLAAALGTSARELLGGGQDAPPGQAPLAAHPVLEELPEEECWAKLAPGGIGRVAMSTDSGPIVLPVNYRVHDGTVVYRTGAGSIPASAAGNRVAFEVDHIDEALRGGWSVLVSGTAVRVDDQVAVEQLMRQGDPDPWAGGERNVWIGIAPSTVTGRTIGLPSAAPPVGGPEHPGVREK